MRRFFPFLMSLSLVGCSRTSSPAAGPSPSFQPGQVWTYQTRPGEEASRIIICLVEQEPTLGEVVHVHVNGLMIKNKRASDGLTRTVEHMPYTTSALRACVMSLESTGAQLPAFQDGYREWQKSKGGAWTVPVAEAIADMAEVLNK